MKTFIQAKMARTADRFTLLYLRIKNAMPQPGLPKLPEKGQGLVEYALILVLVAVVVIIILSVLGFEMRRIYGTLTCAMNSPVDIMDCFEVIEAEPET